MDTEARVLALEARLAAQEPVLDHLYDVVGLTRTPWPSVVQPESDRLVAALGAYLAALVGRLLVSLTALAAVVAFLALVARLLR